MKFLPRGAVTAYHENGRTRPAEVFQVDRWPRRSRWPWLNKLRAEWRNSTPFERVIRVWWWCICAVLGGGAGVSMVALAGCAIILAAG